MIIISTSDRVLYKRCRRKWDWASTQRQNLLPTSEIIAAPLWLGSGFHFALEDWHGYNRFGSAGNAFKAYLKAFKDGQRPADWEDQAKLGLGMLKHYITDWLPRRNEYETLWVNGEPQVEVAVDVDLTSILPPQALRWLGDRGPVIYRMTFDRVVIDSDGRIWIVDYKTAAQFDTMKLETDAQISTYSWGGRLFYGRDIEGILWMQFRKKVPDAPERLVRGGFSTNKQQSTTYGLYSRALIQEFGRIPSKYNEFLNHLAGLETPDADHFIRRDLVRRNLNSALAEQEKIVQEVTEMLNPELALYPNPTKDCSWDCPFRTPCLMRDDGSDWQEYIDENFRVPDVIGYDHSWRKRIRWPEEIAA